MARIKDVLSASLLVFVLFLSGQVYACPTMEEDVLISSSDMEKADRCEEHRIIFKLRPSFNREFSARMSSREDVVSMERTLSSRASNVLDACGIGYGDLKSYPLVGLVSARVGNSSFAALEWLSSRDEVEWAEPVMLRYKEGSTPDDALFSKEWYLNNEGSSELAAELSDKGNWKVFSLKEGADVDVLDAWNVTSGDEEVIVAVMDSGVDYDNVDLKDRMWTNDEEIPGNGIDDDENGFVDDVHGCNGNRLFSEGCREGDPMDDSNDSGHGTHVAGIVAASANGVGTVGVAPGVKIMALRIADKRGYLTTGAILEAGNYLLNQKRYHDVNVRAVNMSFGGPSISNAERELIHQLAEAGILVFAAAGNEGRNSDFFPANFPVNLSEPNILSVGASDGNGCAADFSERGAFSVDVFAPGHGILSTVAAAASSDIKDYDDGQGSYWGIMSGTSMASPVAMGVGALGWSVKKDASWRDMKELLMNSVDTPDAMKGLSRSGGRLNALKAVSLSIPSGPVIFDVLADGAVSPGSSVRIAGNNLEDACSARIEGNGTSTELKILNVSATEIKAVLPPEFSSADARATLIVETDGGDASIPLIVASEGEISPFPKKDGSFSHFNPYKDRCVLFGNYVYGIGYEFEGFRSRFGIYKLDLKTNFTELVVKDLPDDLFLRESVPVLFDGKIYFIGGSSEGKMYCLDPKRDFFYPLKEVLQPAKDEYLIGASLAADEDYIYLAGGWFFDRDKKFDVDQTEVYRWNPDLTDWEFVAHMPSDDRITIRSAAMVHEEKFLLAGGFWNLDRDRRGEVDEVSVLDLNSLEWRSGRLPFAAQLGSLDRIGDRIYYWGGVNVSRGYNGSPYIAYTDVDDICSKWKVLPKRFDFMGLVGNQEWGFHDLEKLYLIGGNFTDRHASFSVALNVDSEFLKVGNATFTLSSGDGIVVKKKLQGTERSSLLAEVEAFLRNRLGENGFLLEEDGIDGAVLGMTFAGKDCVNLDYRISGDVEPGCYPMLFVKDSLSGRLQQVHTDFDRDARTFRGRIRRSEILASSGMSDEALSVETILAMPVFRKTVDEKDEASSGSGGGCNVGELSFLDMLLFLPFLVLRRRC